MLEFIINNVACFRLFPLIIFLSETSESRRSDDDNDEKREKEDEEEDGEDKNGAEKCERSWKPGRDNEMQ